jgi:DNA-binding response OmpR family regulator
MTPTAHPTEDIIHVLFIQDDPAVADMYKLKLELDGYQVAVVANDDQVLEAAARTRPDMIFIDLRVGDDQGFATLQRLRATAGTRHLPVIILSNQEPGEMARRGFKANPLDYVVRADPGPNSLASNLEVWARAGSG